MSERILHEGVEFRQVPNYPGYAVSRCGRVASSKPKRGRGPSTGWNVLSGWRRRDGYLSVSLCGGGNKVSRFVHRLVLMAWVGPCPDGMECRHLNGDPADNRMENLAWGTKQENQADRVRHNTDNRGSRHPLTKLTEADIPVIRRLLSQGKPDRAVGRQFGVSRHAIMRIRKGLCWTHV